MSHNLHEIVGNIVSCMAKDFSTIQIIKSNHCETGKSEIHLYCSHNKSNATEYCDVDLLIIAKEKMRAIIEIEEPNGATPITVFGKLMASAASISVEYEPEEGGKKNLVVLDEPVTFIHILGVKDKGSKSSQYESIRKFIEENVMPIRGSKVNRYKQIYGTVSEFQNISGKGREFIGYIKDLFKSLSES